MASSAPPRMVVGRLSCVSCVVDMLIIFIIGLAILLMFLLATPYQRGFFCDDDSIRYPYKPDTISSAVLIAFAVLIPCGAVLVCEGVAARREGAAGCARRVAVGPCNMPVTVVRLASTLVLFVFGLAAQQIIVDSAKYSVGRLRPHFLAVCAPSPALRQLCANSTPNEYVKDFECTDDDVDRILEARLSFPSGHSSMSFYASIFTILFLARRFHWRRDVRVQVAFLQLLLLLMAWLTALSRISDHKHHWSDVLAGSIIGAVVAAITVLLFVIPRGGGGGGPEAAAEAGTGAGRGAGDALALRPAPSCDTYETLFVI